jgi:flagellar hook protein FlgE
MDASATALQGLQQADAQLNTAAAKIVDAGAASPTAAEDAVNLSEEMVAMIAAQAQFAANLATLKTADQTEQSLVNLTG